MEESLSLSMSISMCGSMGEEELLSALSLSQETINQSIVVVLFCDGSVCEIRSSSEEVNNNNRLLRIEGLITPRVEWVRMRE